MISTQVLHKDDNEEWGITVDFNKDRTIEFAAQLLKFLKNREMPACNVADAKKEWPAPRRRRGFSFRIDASSL